MKIHVSGNVATIKSSVNFEKLAKLGPVYVKNEKGEKVYGAKVSGTPYPITPSGIVFNFSDSEGNACCNLMLAAAYPDPEQTVEFLAGVFEEEFANLQKYEGAINNALAEREIALEAVKAQITVE